MKNVKFDVKGKTLTISVDLSQENGMSKSGKTKTIASTLGNVPLPSPHEEIKVGLNIYKY